MWHISNGFTHCRKGLGACRSFHSYLAKLCLLGISALNLKMTVSDRLFYKYPYLVFTYHRIQVAPAYSCLLVEIRWQSQLCFHECELFLFLSV